MTPQEINCKNVWTWYLGGRKLSKIDKRFLVFIEVSLQKTIFLCIVSITEQIIIQSGS